MPAAKSSGEADRGDRAGQAPEQIAENDEGPQPKEHGAKRALYVEDLQRQHRREGAGGQRELSFNAQRQACDPKGRHGAEQPQQEGEDTEH